MPVVNTGKGGTQAVRFDPSNPVVNATLSAATMEVYQATGGTFAVYFDPAAPAVNASFSAASLEVVPSTGSRQMVDEVHAAQRVLLVGSQSAASLQIVGITESIAAHLIGTAGTLGVRVGRVDDTVTVRLDPGYELGSIKGINSSIETYLGATAGTLGVRVGHIDDTVMVMFSPSVPSVATVSAATSASGVNTETATTGALWAVNTWTGAGEQTNYSHVAVSLQTDETGTLYFDFSVDGTNWSTFPTAGFAIASGVHEMHTATKMGRYFRPRFVGSGGRSYFRLFTYYSDSSLHLNSPLNADILPDSDAQITKSVLIAQAAGSGDFTNIQSTAGGNLKVAVEEISDGLDVGAGNAGAETQRVIVASDQPTLQINVGTVEDTVTVRLDPSYEIGSIRGINSTVAVYFSPSSPAVATTLSGTMSAVPESGQGEPLYDESKNALVAMQKSGETFAVYLDPAEPTIKGITNSISTYLSGTAGTQIVKLDRESVLSGIQSTVRVNVGTVADTVKVQLDPGHELGSVKSINSTVAVYFDPAEPTIKGITNTIGVYLSGTAGTIATKIDPGYNVVNAGSTISLQKTVSGSASGVSVSGNTIKSPVSSRVIKVYAINLTTTAQVHLTAKLTNGSGGSPTEFWRYALQAPSQGISGANIAVSPPAYLFATAATDTLALVLDSASLVHYSIGYFLESA